MFNKDDIHYIGSLFKHAASEGKTFADFNATIARADGRIPPKYRELIALGVALTTQCPYCIDGHTKAAIKQGADEAELSEVVFIAAALRAGAAIAHGSLVMESYKEQLSKSSQQ